MKKVTQQTKKKTIQKKAVLKKKVTRPLAKKTVQKGKKVVSLSKKVSSKKAIKKPPVVVAVSGGFDPIHIGHVRMFNEAKALGDKLVVIVNNDNWLRDKKGKEFMSEMERKEIIEGFAAVDKVILTSHTEGEYHTDKSVCRELRVISPHIFANGGDRFADDIPEFKLCNELGIEMFFNVGTGGKIQSSSWLLAKHKE